MATVANKRQHPESIENYRYQWYVQQDRLRPGSKIFNRFMAWQHRRLSPRHRVQLVVLGHAPAVPRSGADLPASMSLSSAKTRRPSSRATAHRRGRAHSLPAAAESRMPDAA